MKINDFTDSVAKHFEASGVALQLAIFPTVGLQADLRQHLAISAGFTLLSFLRSFALRRVFERLP